ncbi:MAG: tyrosine-protein phosphatase [Gemmiger formicilis]|uniref:tyrosine-protein phosphatase n=1 Tax=Gemmiger formicilis TaxID=745368 RepID=UPI0039A2ABA1
MQVVFSPGAEIKFEGANNFRELGGYRASDGRQVKYGLLYRGGNLDLLKSEADHARLASLGLREILDLRSAGRALRTPIRRSRGRTTGASAVCATPTAPR